MKVVLLFPPQWAVVMPYLAIPSLTAFLRQHGHEVVQHDLNLEVYKLLFDHRFLGEMAVKVEARLGLLEGKAQLRGEEGQAYRALCKADMASDYTVDYAREGYHDLSLRRRELFVKGASDLWSAAYYPASISTHHFRPSYCRSEGNLARAVLDEKENIFLRVFREHLLDSILREEAGLIGISIMDYGQLIPAITLASLIRECDKDVHITVGGYVFTNHVDTLMRERWLFDYFSSVIVHEGELPLLRLVNALEEGRGFDGVPHLIYREGEEVRVNPSKEIVDLNSLPTPVYDGFPLEFYTLSESVSLASSRGCCWNKCAFCNATYVFDDIRDRDINLVIGDMVKLNKEYGVNQFAFTDSAISPARLRALAEGIQETGLEVRWTGEARVEKEFTPELCRLLVESGCACMRWGVESGSNRLLKVMNKGTTIELVHAVLKNSKEAGVYNHAYIIAGFPSEEWEDVQKTLDFLIDNREIIDSTAISEFELRPNSPVMYDPERYHITSLESDALGEYKYTVDGGLSQAEVQKALLYLRQELANVYPRFALEGWRHPFQPLPVDDVEPVSPAGAPPLEDSSDWDKVYLELKEGVFQGALYFDKEGNRFQEDRWALYDLHNGRLYSLKAQVREFLNACEDKMSLGEVASKLSTDYGLPVEKVKTSSLNFVRTLCQRDLATLREGRGGS